MIDSGAANRPGRDFTSTLQESANMSIPAALVRPPCVRTRELPTRTAR